jgi:hypothetical protein
MSLPPAHRNLLEAVGASQWQIADGPIGSAADEMLRSAGQPGIAPPARARLDGAIGAWIPGLQVLLINVGHAAIVGLDPQAYEAFVAHVAWHEWGHALSMARCSSEDLVVGEIDCWHWLPKVFVKVSLVPVIVLRVTPMR